MDSYLRYVNKEERVFGKPPIGCVLDLAGRPFSGDKILDNSPYGNNGAITGAIWKRNECGLWYLSFDGVDDVVTITDAASLDFAATESFTIKVWIKCADFLAYRSVLIKAGTGSIYYYMRVDITDGYVFCRIGDGAFDPFVGTIATTTITAGVWYHIVFQRDVPNDLLRVFINGVQKHTATDTTTGTLANDGNLLIGNNAALTQDFYGGIALLEEIRGVWIASDVLNSYNREKHLFGV